MKRTKIVILIFLLVFGVPMAASAASVTLYWDANTEPDLAGYNVYYGTSSRNYGNPIPVGNTTSYDVDNLVEGVTYYFAVTALDTSGNESGFSTEEIANATSSEPATEPYQLVVSTNSNRSNSVALANQTISDNVYIFILPENAVSQVDFSIDGKFHNTERYAPYDLGLPYDTTELSNGSHTISALITLKDNSKQTISAVIDIANKLPEPNSVALSASQSSPQTEGQQVVFTARGSGGSGSYEYKFWERGPGTNGAWVIVQNFSSSDAFTWDSTGKAGTTEIGVWVRNAGSDVDEYNYARVDIDTFTIQTASAAPMPSYVQLSSNLISPQTEGQQVVFTARGSGGSGSYEYKFCTITHSPLVPGPRSQNLYS